MTTTNVQLFASDLYDAKTECATGLASDVRLLPEVRKTWGPATVTAIVNETAAGRYLKCMEGVVLSENMAWTTKLKNFPQFTRAVDAPPRLGLVARDKVFVAPMSELMEVPDAPFGYTMAEVGFGYTWGIMDATLLCHGCVDGCCVSSMFTIFYDYSRFLPSSPEVAPVIEKTAELLARYINHVHREHGADGLERKIMDAWVMCNQAVYLDALHTNDRQLLCMDDELRSIKYRLISSGFIAYALQFKLEQDASAIDDDIATAVAVATLTMHEACERRHDNRGNAYYNLLTIVSAHTGLESVDLVRRFCIDVWAWTIDSRSDWAIRGAGRVLMSQIHVNRYQAAVLLDHLTVPDPGNKARVDPYGDAVLNSLNPLQPSASPHNYSLRDRCQDKARYDDLLRSSLTHFEECPGCRGYNTASWRERVQLVTAAFDTKITRMDCVNKIAVYTTLSLPDEFWWAADPAARYTGPTEEWSINLS
ncbi:hypothetical protein MAJ_10878, partial [Metarhizium majus ARSEF 297]